MSEVVQEPTQPPQRPAGDMAGGRRRRGGRATWLGRALAGIGGMRPELVDEFPGERRDFIQMAVILFVTALEAFLSGAFAVNLAFSKPGEPGLAPWILVVCGLVWAFMIFNIDRYMVLGMEGLHRGHAAGPAVIRMVLAVLIGFVMSTPLVLQLFQSEVEAQVALLNQKAGEEAKDALQPFEKKVADATAAVDARRKELDAARSGYSVAGDPVYQAALNAWQLASTECAKAESKATREQDGTLPVSEGGSGKSGQADLYWTYKAQADQACALSKQKKATLDEAERAAHRTPEQVQDGITQAEGALKKEQTTLDKAITARDLAADRLRKSAEGYGVLIRLQALSEISHKNTTAGLTHYALVALLASIEILPVGFKVLKQWNKEPTAYECRWRDMDLTALERGRAIETRALSAARRASLAPVEAAEEHQRQQSAVNAHIAREIAGVQLEVMRRQLRDWAQRHNVAFIETPFVAPPPGAATAWPENDDHLTTPPPGGPPPSAGAGPSAEEAGRDRTVANPDGPSAEPGTPENAHAPETRLSWAEQETGDRRPEPTMSPEPMVEEDDATSDDSSVSSAPRRPSVIGPMQRTAGFGWHFHSEPVTPATPAGAPAGGHQTSDEGDPR